MSATAFSRDLPGEVRPAAGATLDLTGGTQTATSFETVFPACKVIFGAGASGRAGASGGSARCPPGPLRVLAEPPGDPSGGTGLPFFSLRSYAGSDLLSVNPAISTVESPYGDGAVAVVPPLRPDLVILYAQRRDRPGDDAYRGRPGHRHDRGAALVTARSP
ncbi:MAG: catI [Actinobacteria bacterium]|nr:catI [Actinomycetota bacterium]